MMSVKKNDDLLKYRELLLSALKKENEIEQVSRGDKKLFSYENWQLDVKNIYKEMNRIGHLIYDSYGMEGLHSSLIWEFVPEEQRQVVNCAWDGVGEWRY